MVLRVVLLVVWGALASIARPYLSSASPPDMVRIETGVYTPLFTDGKDGEHMVVDAFYLDVYPVTQAQYLAFVEANPQWRRPQVARLFADQAYLQSWQDDQGAARPPDALLQRPVTQVSWFAARAYCQWQGKRLPRLAEWEYTALASDTAPDGRHNPASLVRLLEWYTRPMPAVPPTVGSGTPNYWRVHDLHGVIWEWVADFQTMLVTGESRGDSDVERNLFCGAGVTGAAAQARVDYAAFMRYAYRSSLRGNYTGSHLGFRCARDVP